MAMTMRRRGSLTRCEPRWETPRSPERETFGHQIAKVAARLGQPFMPWQEQVALVGGEIDPDTGVPAYREVVITVPRQSGKTTLVLSWEVQRAVGWRHLGPQRIAYSAQTGNDARKKLIRDQVPILTPHKKALGIRRVLKGMGNESVEWLNGSQIVLLASSEDSGHGPTVDLGIKDELFADVDDRRDQALVPAMATKPAAQIITASTMGTEESVPLNQAVERGRVMAEAGIRSGTAYFEWSADEDSDPDDEDVWWGCMPALGFTQGVAAIRHARQTLALAEFRRAFLNIRDGRRQPPVIDAAAWAACAVPSSSRPSEPLALAFDVTPDRSWSAVGIAGAHPAGTQGEVADHRPGTGWVVDRLVELRDRYRPALIVYDATGPAAALADKAEQAGLELRPVSTREHQAACGSLYDAVTGTPEFEGGPVTRTFAHIGQPELNAAVDGATKRMVGDAWLWNRKSSSIDICPLVAVTLAVWAHSQAPAPASSLWVA